MDSEACHLDKRVKLVWFFPTGAAIVLLWLLASLLYAALAPEGYLFGLSHLAFPFALLAFLILFFGLPLYFWVELTYQNFTHQLTDQEIIIREGVITRKTAVIPYSRIQDISSVRSLIERLFGLATIEIETAGSSRVASETLIPGVSNKDEFIHEIMVRVDKARREGGMAPGKEEPAGPSVPQLLSEVLKELKTISFKLDNLPKASGKNEAVPKPRAQKKGETDFDEYEQFKKR